MVVAIFVHEVTCDDGELITDTVRGAKRAHPLITSAVVIITAAHLLGWLHRKADPYMWVGLFFQLVKGNHDS